MAPGLPDVETLADSLPHHAGQSSCLSPSSDLTRG
jgi:hypothetical protein